MWAACAFLSLTLAANDPPAGAMTDRTDTERLHEVAHGTLAPSVKGHLLAKLIKKGTTRAELAKVIGTPDLEIGRGPISTELWYGDYDLAVVVTRGRVNWFVFLKRVRPE